jgi:deoxyribodipyrimidine photo-lyase
MTDTVLWFRRDLRLLDQPALEGAHDASVGGGVLPLFVLDPFIWNRSGKRRRVWLLRSLRALREATNGALVLRSGAPEVVIPKVIDSIGAHSVHVTGDSGPYGRARDERVEQQLRGIPLVRHGSPYAIAPGEVTKPDGTAYRVFTAYFRSWQQHSAAMGPDPRAHSPHWLRGPSSDPIPDEPAISGDLPPAGEEAAIARWHRFRGSGLCRYREDRDRPDHMGTSMLSTHLKFGEIHPRTIMGDLCLHRCTGAAAFRRQLAWRDFYADVLWHSPNTARESLRPEFEAMVHDEPGVAFERWCEGRTGYPFVDAGMRQLNATGWLHNRARMVVASFLIKDLHVHWRHGARYFMRQLRDGDLASNQHGWQWVAGSGTDAAPYFRVFNPVLQGIRFDPHGDYVRRWVPELEHLPGSSAHEPWSVPGGYAAGYAERIIEHEVARREALRRFERLSTHRDI